MGAAPEPGFLPCLRAQLLSFSSESRENAALESKLEAAKNAGNKKIAKRLKYAEMKQELRDLHALVDSIPPEILAAAKRAPHKSQERCGKYR